MVFSAKTDYGLIALMDLAEASGTDQLLQTREISARHAIPERYLEQTLTSLRKAGYLRSLRGRPGAVSALADLVAELLPAGAPGLPPG